MKTDRCGMALIECPDCGKRISDQATECNQCGRPMKTAQTDEESAEGSSSPDSESVKAGSQSLKLLEDPGAAVGGIGAGVGIVVMVLHSLAVGLVVAGVAVAVGLWIQYGPFRRRRYGKDET